MYQGLGLKKFNKGESYISLQSLYVMILSSFYVICFYA